MSDFLVIGGGIAGAAAGFFLREHGDVTLLEAEPAPGLHATGRSAALLSEYFGGAAVRAMTTESRAFYAAPPPGFAETPLLRPRGALAIGTGSAFEAALAAGSAAPEPAYELNRVEARRLLPVLRPDAGWRALLRPGVCDVDVTAVLDGFLRGIRSSGGKLVTDARVRALRRSGGVWHVETAAGTFRAPVVVNATGAWADEVAALAGVPRAGLVPRRRTLALLSAPTGADSWPLLTDVPETCYLKPGSGGLLLSPADTGPMWPGRPQPDEPAIAAALARLETLTTLRVRRVVRSWAGLRSAAGHDEPVIGAGGPGFHWLAGLGGYGVQIAPAAGRLLAGLVSAAVTEVRSA